jgi:predicted RNA-binding protein with PUA-like domain
MSMKYWLMKSEPECYSIDDLKNEKVGMWDGTRNYQVRNFMRDDIKRGDAVLFYHSNAGKNTGVAGVMKVVKEAYPDPTQFDPQSEHPDPKSDPNNPRWLAVNVRYVKKFSRIVTLKELKNDKRFRTMRLLERGNRLSVMPVEKTHFETICRLAEK